MSDYNYGGAADIDRAIGVLVGLDNVQKNALAVLEFDEAIDELQKQYELATAATDPVEALDTIRRAVTHARDADALARYDAR